MENDAQEGLPEDEAPPETVPAQWSTTMKGFAAEADAQHVGEFVVGYVKELSRYIDLRGLEGVTVAFDYRAALREVDLGFETTQTLEPSDDLAVGIAMTASVLRDGEVKSHMVFNANVMVSIADRQNENFGLALHTLAHECAHVEVASRLEAAFPGELVNARFNSVQAARRRAAILDCWEEYEVTRRSARFGADPTDGYESLFVDHLAASRPKANELIIAYRTHGDVEKVLGEVYEVYASLLKFASYHLGNLAGHGRSVAGEPKTNSALDGHWFAPYLERLVTACDTISADYGTWKDRTAFEALGDLIDDVVAEGGVVITELGDGMHRVDVPFSEETIP
jgi:hypothetical protein